MSSYYGNSGYPPQQPGGTGSAGDGSYYGNTSSSTAGNSGQQQQQQQQGQQFHQQPQGQQSAYSGYGQQQQWQQAPQQQQQQQQQQPGMMPQQQQPGGMMQQQQSVFNPASAAMFAAAAASGNPALMDGMAKQGEMWLKGGVAKMIPGLELTMLTLRTYFAVDNRYVKRKMIKIIFPFRDTSWTRLQNNDPSQTQQQQQGHLQTNYALPNSDENAPDLYIPTMSFITYVLLCALLFGTAGKFNPEVIPDVATRCIVTGIIEVLAFKVAFMSMQVSPVAIALLDLLSYVGYKYFGLCINMVIGLIMSLDFIPALKGQRGYWISFIWTSAAATYFMLKTMANNIPLTTNPNGPKREIMVFVFAVSQLVTMWFVSQTKLLD